MWLKWISVFFKNLDDFIDEKYINDKKKFTRKGKLTLKNIIHYILIQKGRSNAIEAYEFCMNFKNDICESVTASAIGQKRKYLDFKIFIDMNKFFINKIYGNKKDLVKFKGYLVFSCDGSKLALPNYEEVKKAFNIKWDYYARTYLARTRVSCIIDSYSNLILDCILTENENSEPKLAIEHMKNLNKRIGVKKTITLYDRGYCCVELMLQHILHGSCFIIRLKSNVFKDERESMTSKDEFVNIAMNQERIGDIEDEEIQKMMKNRPYEKLRITEVKLESGEIEYLISNLPMEKFTTNDLKELYYKRWKIETAFDFLKNVIQIENFTARRELLIKQDFYASILFYNISMTLKQYVEYTERASNKLKEDWAINYNVTVGILKIELWNILPLSSNSRIMEKLKSICNVLKKAKIKINKTLRKDMKVKTSDKTAKFHQNKRFSTL